MSKNVFFLALILAARGWFRPEVRDLLILEPQHQMERP
jgi:hypothetical protein